MSEKIIHIVAGPTASGKSAYAMALAAAENGVIINCDSMQIYDGLHILTAQPDDDDKRAVSHMLYGILHPNEVCSAGNWREMVEPIITGILEEGKIPIITGGTGLYIKGLMDGLSPIPDIPPNVRAWAVALQQELGNPGFHAALAERDSVMAARFHPYHTARLVRAWEVLEATGKSLAEWQKEPRDRPPDDWDFRIHKIMPERSELRARCDARFDVMLSKGVLDEVEAFEDRIERGEVSKGVPLTKALGFSMLRDYIKGKIPKEQAVEKVKTQTRQYAKRQTTWFRNQL